jgi:hypothetical protein
VKEILDYWNRRCNRSRSISLRVEAAYAGSRKSRSNARVGHFTTMAVGIQRGRKREALYFRLGATSGTWTAIFVAKILDAVLPDSSRSSEATTSYSTYVMSPQRNWMNQQPIEWTLRQLTSSIGSRESGTTQH